jgi:hypothetical protein
LELRRQHPDLHRKRGEWTRTHDLTRCELLRHASRAEALVNQQPQPAVSFFVLVLIVARDADDAIGSSPIGEAIPRVTSLIGA